MGQEEGESFIHKIRDDKPKHFRGKTTTRHQGSKCRNGTSFLSFVVFPCVLLILFHVCFGLTKKMFHIFFFFVQAKELVQQKGPEARNKMQDQNRGPELIRHKARCPDSAASRKAA